MARILVREEGLNECCLEALARHTGTEIENDYLDCTHCPNRMRVKNGGWERWPFYDELPPGAPEKWQPRDHSPKGPASTFAGMWANVYDLIGEPRAETDSPPALRGEKIPFLSEDDDSN